MIKVERVVTGTDELTLEVAKLWMKVDDTADDTLITSLITEAKNLIEEYINYTITPSTITVTATARTKLFLPYPPIVAITSVKDMDGEDVEYEYEDLYIEFDTVVYSVTAPENVYVQTVTIYTSGSTSIPTGLMLAWKEIVLYLYENRGDTNIGQLLLNNHNLQEYRTKIWI
jgi:long-subunit acyl-CoA synthetase (AMP-forming)